MIETDPKKVYKAGGMRLETAVRSAVVISHNRSGGTFLSHCLDSHYAIHCCLDEPLHGHSWHRKIFNASTEQILDFELHRPQVEVSMCKISHTQFTDLVEVAPYLKDNGIKIIHLTRDNILLSALSEVVRHQQYKPTHAFYERPLFRKINIDPKKVVEVCDRMRSRRIEVMKLIKFYEYDEVLYLDYKDLVGEEGREVVGIPIPTGEKICDYLEVGYAPLLAPSMRKVSYPPAQTILNWEEVKREIKGTIYKKFIPGVEAIRVEEEEI